ncbi:MAG: PepSY domain-containing protein [Syntrophobacteraceae bacterium]|nr:PepSY domain-containing protein [Syntrophobacteraceae bacterium]
MNLCRILKITTVAVIFGMAMPVTPYAYPGRQFSSQAKVTIDQARSIAEKAVPGKIVTEELEKEKGGSGLRYSFDIKGKDGVVHEVGVDAKSGKVLERSIEHKGAD